MKKVCEVSHHHHQVEYLQKFIDQVSPKMLLNTNKVSAELYQFPVVQLNNEKVHFNNAQVAMI